MSHPVMKAPKSLKDRKDLGFIKEPKPLVDVDRTKVWHIFSTFYNMYRLVIAFTCLPVQFTFYHYRELEQ